MTLWLVELLEMALVRVLGRVVLVRRSGELTTVARVLERVSRPASRFVVTPVCAS